MMKKLEWTELLNVCEIFYFILYTITHLDYLLLFTGLSAVRILPAAYTNMPNQFIMSLN
jgi:hypothetical protein